MEKELSDGEFILYFLIAALLYVFIGFVIVYISKAIEVTKKEDSKYWKWDDDDCMIVIFWVVGAIISIPYGVGLAIKWLFTHIVGVPIIAITEIKIAKKRIRAEKKERQNEALSNRFRIYDTCDLLPIPGEYGILYYVTIPKDTSVLDQYIYRGDYGDYEYHGEIDKDFLIAALNVMPNKQGRERLANEALDIVKRYTE